MKKKFLLTTVGVSLLSVGLTTANLSQVVHATKVTTGKTAKFTHNAYIYNSKGKRVKKSTLKKNKTTKVIKIIKIKGKNYAQIGKNQFVKLSNLKGVTYSKKHKSKSTKSNSEVTLSNQQDERIIEPSEEKKITPEELKYLGFKEDKDNPNKWFYDRYAPGVKMIAKKDTVISVGDYSANLEPLVPYTSIYETGVDSRGTYEHYIYEDNPMPDVSYTVKFPKDSYVYWYSPYKHVYVDTDKETITYDANNDFGLNDIDMFGGKYTISLNDVKLEKYSGDKVDQKEQGNTTNIRVLPRNGKFNTKDGDSIDFAELKARGLLQDINVKEKAD